MNESMKSCLIMLSLILVLAGCGNSTLDAQNKKDELETNTNEQIQIALDTIENMKGESFENIEIDEKTVVNISLNGDSIETNGKGVNIEGSIATIITAGDYYISGTLNDGQIIVDAGENNVNLILANAYIKSESSSPIYVKSAKNTIITLEAGSNNYIEDATTYIYENNEEDEPDSAIFSKDDLYITGTGTLNIKANYNDAIKSKDDFSVFNGEIVIDSVDDGIVGKDSVSIRNANITINAGGDGIKSTNENDEEKGYIAIESGIFNITAQSDGIQAQTNINIAGGNFKIMTGGGSSVSSSTTNNNQIMDKRKWGEWETKLDKTDTQSAKGLKAENNLTIMGGTFDIDSSDDAIHCNNDIVVNGGSIDILTGDDGIHADNYIEITDGNINIEKSYEGIEASVINIKGGNIKIVSSDDGINVAGGNDMSSLGGRMGQNQFSSNSNNYLIIEGGNIFVDASGDGLDANGSMYIKGGKIEIAGPTNNGNGALDYDKECIVTGGELIAYGASGMSQNPSSSSTQYIITINGNYSANDAIAIANDNETILTYTLSKNCQAIIISSDSFEKNKKYIVYLNDEAIDEIEISSIITTIGKNNQKINNEGQMNREDKFMNRNEQDLDKKNNDKKEPGMKMKK